MDLFDDSARMRRLKQIIDNCNYINQIKCQFCRHNEHCREYVIYTKLKAKEDEAQNAQKES